MIEASTTQHSLKEAFLEALASTGNATSSARKIGIGRSTAYSWRLSDPDFASRWEDAIAMATDRLAFEARRRALDGGEEVRYFKGEPGGSIRRYSDQLLMFLLRAYRPDVYRNPRPTPTQNDETIQKARDALTQKLENLLTTMAPAARKELINSLKKTEIELLLIAPGLKSTVALNQFSVQDDDELISNDGTEVVWQLEFAF